MRSKSFKNEEEDPREGCVRKTMSSEFEIRDIFHFVGRCVKVVWEWSQEPINQLILIVLTTIVFGSLLVIVFFHCVHNVQKWCDRRGSPSHHRRTCRCSNHPRGGSASLLPQTDGAALETQQPMLVVDSAPDAATTATDLTVDEELRPPEPPVDPSAPPVEEVLIVDVPPEGPLPSSPPPPPYNELLELEELTGHKLWEEECDSDDLPPYEHFSRIDSRDGFVRISQV